MFDVGVSCDILKPMSRISSKRVIGSRRPKSKYGQKSSPSSKMTTQNNEQQSDMSSGFIELTAQYSMKDSKSRKNLETGQITEADEQTEFSNEIVNIITGEQTTGPNNIEAKLTKQRIKKIRSILMT